MDFRIATAKVDLKRDSVKAHISCVCERVKIEALADTTQNRLVYIGFARHVFASQRKLASWRLFGGARTRR